MATQLSRIAYLSPLVIRVLGCNPGPMTLQGTNTYIIGNGPKRLLLDTGEPNNDEYISTLRNVLNSNNISLETILVTHWHHDHTGGIPNILKLCEEKNVKVRKLKNSLQDNFDYAYLEDKEEIKVDGATLKVIHTPGHTTDHFVLNLAEENAIFSGDCILGEGTAVFENLYTYMKSLQTILEIKPTVVYPGHGPIIDNPVEKITYYIAHRNLREQQIMDVLKANPNMKFSAYDLVRKIYLDTPEYLYTVAAINITHHLHKLVKEGKVSGDEDTDQWMLMKCNL